MTTTTTTTPPGSNDGDACTHEGDHDDAPRDVTYAQALSEIRAGQLTAAWTRLYAPREPPPEAHLGSLLTATLLHDYMDAVQRERVREAAMLAVLYASAPAYDRAEAVRFLSQYLARMLELDLRHDLAAALAAGPMPRDYPPRLRALAARPLHRLAQHAYAGQHFGSLASLQLHAAVGPPLGAAAAELLAHFAETHLHVLETSIETVARAIADDTWAGITTADADAAAAAAADAADADDNCSRPPITAGEARAILAAAAKLLAVAERHRCALRARVRDDVARLRQRKFRVDVAGEAALTVWPPAADGNAAIEAAPQYLEVAPVAWLSATETLAQRWLSLEVSLLHHRLDAHFSRLQAAAMVASRGLAAVPDLVVLGLREVWLRQLHAQRPDLLAETLSLDRNLLQRVLHCFSVVLARYLAAAEAAGPDALPAALVVMVEVLQAIRRLTPTVAELRSEVEDAANACFARLGLAVRGTTPGALRQLLAALLDPLAPLQSALDDRITDAIIAGLTRPLERAFAAAFSGAATPAATRHSALYALTAAAERIQRTLAAIADRIVDAALTQALASAATVRLVAAIERQLLFRGDGARDGPRLTASDVVHLGDALDLAQRALRCPSAVELPPPPPLLPHAEDAAAAAGQRQVPAPDLDPWARLRQLQALLSLHSAQDLDHIYAADPEAWWTLTPDHLDGIRTVRTDWSPPPVLPAPPPDGTSR